ncbi:hypothetical protein GCM10009789_83690 [Kribbella sancticallisti]|uniref:Uncharacterized protein n=1 Tax=Kribbella sancticallisti TaxID=460087 RepID=A0ABN2ETW6_9ACTN
MPDLAARDVIQLIELGGRSGTPAAGFVAEHVKLPMEFHGWRVRGLSAMVTEIVRHVRRFGAELVVLQSEVWDLMRELTNRLGSRCKVAAILHAMPFLTTPVRPTGDFPLDVGDRLRGEQLDYRRSYIEAHHHEFYDVADRMSFIPANRTVAYYLDLYLPRPGRPVLDPPVALRMPTRNETAVGRTSAGQAGIRLCYMARIEPGKGLEHLGPIMDRIAAVLPGAHLSVLGSADDTVSRLHLDELLAARQGWTTRGYGWADADLKAEMLGTSDVFLYPSNSDSLSISMLEALAHGVPVVAWELPFTRLNYRATRAVSLVPFGDVSAFGIAALTAYGNADSLRNDAVRFAGKFCNPRAAAASERQAYRMVVAS